MIALTSSIIVLTNIMIVLTSGTIVLTESIIVLTNNRDWGAGGCLVLFGVPGGDSPNWPTEARRKT